MPDVPTLKEVGDRMASRSSLWLGVLAPAGTPREIVNTAPGAGNSRKLRARRKCASGSTIRAQSLSAIRLNNFRKLPARRSHALGRSGQSIRGESRLDSAHGLLLTVRAVEMVCQHATRPVRYIPEIEHDACALVERGVRLYFSRLLSPVVRYIKELTWNSRR